jgi:periplasmic protein TonB
MVHKSETELICDEILFEKRNKSYGAYDLRNSYNNHLIAAGLIATVFFTIVVLFPKISSLFKFSEVKKEEYKITEVILAEPPPIDPKTTPPPPPNVQAPPPKIASTKFLPPKIMEDDKVKEEEEPPKQEDMKDTNPGEETRKGESENLNEVIVSGNGNGGDENEILIQVGEPPVFKGDYIGFLRKNMRYPNKALNKDIEGKVTVAFVVEKDGSITDLKLIKGIGYGCDEEAMRVISMTNGKWTPPKNNGVAVRYHKYLAVTFSMPKDEE